MGRNLSDRWVAGDPTPGRPKPHRENLIRELDRLAQQLTGTRTQPAAMPMDAYRQGDQFIVEFDPPGVDPDSIESPSSATSSPCTPRGLAKPAGRRSSC
jgi:HSP20 family molecular chaperone IbpA